ncbi:RNA polymerase sigma factor [Posidoniimonas polymericola]|uniref:RNA polymerase sigma factor n=1 Tax=Posidoniimonas polymericola TaxID=2528002 RepID=A0A5C5YQX8_9BACT|nr:sigma-70 family RNA polymerase sigma factor [Posidoniimonas polymericola]TWT77259.1 RNA polymerase sigma factor [Posidoniimonas polymericola]
MSEPDGSESRDEEFLQLFAQSQRALHAYLIALVFDPNTAADLLQETNIVLWRKFDHYESGTNFFAWAREVARLTVLRHRRTSSRRIATLDPQLLEELAGRFSESQETADTNLNVLSGCLDRLRPGDRELIVGRYAPGASVTGLAEKLGRPANSISQSLCRIRKALADCVQRQASALERGADGVGGAWSSVDA